MAKNAVAVLAFFFTAIQLLLASLHIRGVEATIGVNYGTVANDLPPPSKVTHFFLESTFINSVRLFDANSEVLKAFAFTGIALTITIPNGQIPSLTKLSFAQQWVKTSIVPFTPATNVVRILVGNEAISTTNRVYMGSLVPAMQNLHTALIGESLDFCIKVSTPHSLGSQPALSQHYTTEERPQRHLPLHNLVRLFAHLLVDALIESQIVPHVAPTQCCQRRHSSSVAADS
ncbi:hypothetical protein RJ639_032694 [Escallonia herrerae]|uniref:Glucan endo-1,3-beta-D-glucosidase n=1 Tax=Escallonia herrerae TaxID=1293975 RepID=A0AA89BK58_9ASTE|nr:hypothetical protein RJ639_032694 [Escallonia herrerae]